LNVAQVVRELGAKYVQLEQVVMSALSQNGGNYKNSQDYTILSFVLKNVLMEIMHAKAVINGNVFIFVTIYSNCIFFFLVINLETFDFR
jgi:hypothetical protein